MINFNYTTNFRLSNEVELSNWISEIIILNSCVEGDINYIFMNDNDLHKLNVEYLDHDTLTDIISFDYSVGNNLHGDIYISVDRVLDNSKDFNVSFSNELHRVLIHGVLHYCGFKDKTESDALLMRQKEDEALNLLSI